MNRPSVAGIERRVRKLFRFPRRFGILVLLCGAGLLTTVYLIRVGLTQAVLDRVLEKADLIEARALVSSISLRSLTVADFVLAGDGWNLELDGLRSTHDVWSLRVYEIETGEGRLFVDVDRILNLPTSWSLDELSDMMESVQSALPEMDFTSDNIQVELVLMGRPIKLTVGGKGSLSSAHRLAVFLKASVGKLFAEVALKCEQPG